MGKDAVYVRDSCLFENSILKFASSDRLFLSMQCNTAISRYCLFVEAATSMSHGEN